jgi:DNA-binding transcriptional LysR family regulator
MSRLAEIETFIAVAESGSVTRAATQLGVAKSAVSRRLSDLEARLGAQLIQRTTRQSSLTDEGASYLLNAKQALEALDAAEDELRSQQCNLSGTLRVAAPASYGLTEMEPIFARFMQDHPNVDLYVDLSDNRVDLVQEGFDLAIRIGILQDSTLIASKITSIRNRCVASPAFWREHGIPKTASDLEQLPFLRYSAVGERDGLNFISPDGKRGTIHPPQRLRASSGEFLTQMAAQSIGFCVDPEFISEGRVRDGKLQAVLMDHDWGEANLYAIMPPNRRTTRRAKTFIEYLKQALRKPT